MLIKQCGTSMARVIPQMTGKNCRLTDIFSIVRPHISLDFQSICSQIMSVFVLSTKSGILDLKIISNGNGKKDSPKQSSTPHDSHGEEKECCTRFKGQMVYLSEKQLILFLCSPSVMSIDDLYMQVFLF